MIISSDKYINISDICWTLPQTSPVWPPKCLNAIDVTNRDAKIPEEITKKSTRKPNAGIVNSDIMSIDKE